MIHALLSEYMQHTLILVFNFAILLHSCTPCEPTWSLNWLSRYRLCIKRKTSSFLGRGVCEQVIGGGGGLPHFSNVYYALHNKEIPQEYWQKASKSLSGGQKFHPQTLRWLMVLVCLKPEPQLCLIPSYMPDVLHLWGMIWYSDSGIYGHRIRNHDHLGFINWRHNVRSFPLDLRAY